ncbi:MAG: ABC transporter ATP-binding protein [Planctomycetes bacterium]|mgnify:CR=1 FL=1|nr:ABC transporter ATP-binding protein [Planctomycetota bacterium]MCB9909190.1 ABC transporter ATP-binding protein [Planctomycetota bacterium]HRV80043.1 ABC transporter ATP-binding protein [Planctomycetota bacterium]
MYEKTNTGERASGGGSAIVARGLGKTYLIYDKPIQRLWDLMLPGPSRGKEFWAVRDVYLDIPSGSTVGIIGENGAGKSTLLKLLTGITHPTEGEVIVQGRVASLLELGAGFHPQFSGAENIRLNCSILGMGEDEIRERFDKIVEFSELGEFIHRPVNTYSSGMQVRLGFSVATSVDPDILIIDEALAVGDEHFKGKCINRLNEFKEQGKTTLFVSHDMGSIKSMCQQVILMHEGRVLEQGTAEDVADEYLKRAHARGNERLSAINRTLDAYPRWGSGEVRTGTVELLSSGNTPTHTFEPGVPFKVRVHYEVQQACKDPVFGLGLYRSDGTYINGSNHSWRKDPIQIGPVQPGEKGFVEMAFESLPLLKGQYYLTVFVYDHSKPAPTPVDHREHAVTFEVLDGSQTQHGILFLPTRWSVTRGKAKAQVSEE